MYNILKKFLKKFEYVYENLGDDFIIFATKCKRLEKNIDILLKDWNEFSIG